MLLSFNLLKKYVALPKAASAEEVALKLTEKVVEVEAVTSQAAGLENIYVGKVVEVKKHPNADKLKVALVDVGARNAKTPVRLDSQGSAGRHKAENTAKTAKLQLVQVVCGGTNLKDGMLAAVALPGAKIRWHGAGEPVELAATAIRGVKSAAMLCAANEIGLFQLFPHQEMEILDLGESGCKVGDNLAGALGLDDEIIEIDNKSITNRPDLWSHYGIGRELAALYGTELQTVEIDLAVEINPAVPADFKVEIKAAELCRRYLACNIKNISIAPSPAWMQKALQAAGVKIINNIVDITNYVMIELGQPLHAFDAARISADQPAFARLVVRKAVKGERLITLDEEVRQLDENMLVIANDSEPLALAGVMGGQASGINGQTKEIIFESANFDPTSVRKTSQALGVRSESSIRFEKDLDARLAESALRRALFLIKTLIPGAEVVGGILEAGGVEKKDKVLDVSLAKLNSLTGTDLSSDKVVDILEKLGFEIIRRLSPEESDDVIFKIKVPSWRATGDIQIAEDIIEEVARLYGYGQIQAQLPRIGMAAQPIDQLKTTLDKAREILSLGCGMSEVCNYAFLPRGDAGSAEIELENPLSEDLVCLRGNLMPGLLKNIRANARFYEKFKLYEVGRVFQNNAGEFGLGGKAKGQLPRQPYHLAGMAVDKKQDTFLEAKGVIAALLRALGIRNYELRVTNRELSQRLFWQETYLQDGKLLAIVVGAEPVGWLGSFQAQFLLELGIKNRQAAGFEIDLNRLVELAAAGPGKIFTPLPKYPSIERDIALEVEKNVHWGDIVKVVEGIGPLVKRVEFLSEYQLENKKSLAFRVVYLDENKTLEDSEVAKVEQKIVGKLKEKFGGRLRS